MEQRVNQVVRDLIVVYLDVVVMEALMEFLRILLNAQVILLSIVTALELMAKMVKMV